MKLLRFNISLLAFVAACAFAHIASAADTDRTYTGGWRTSDDVVTGWDWTLPPTVEPAAASGLFTINNNAYPSGWPGAKIRVINATWRDLEPSPGNYDFSSIKNYLDDPNYDGIFLNVRGFVTSFPNQPQEVTAPSWATVANGYPTYTTNGGVGAITSLVAFNANVKTKHLALIAALKNSGILTSPRLWGQIIHMPGASRGEEFNTDQGNVTASTAVAIEYIQAWAAAAGTNAKRLMWTDDRGGTAEKATINDAALAAGVGARGGAIESWLWNQYTPGFKKYTLQTYNNGYLEVDETAQMLVGNRAWHDQNEAAGVYDNPANSLQQQNWRMASLRTLQMRRNLIWVDASYRMNPEMSKWMSLEAGHAVTTSPDAWVCLMRTWTRSSNDGTGFADREIKNFERWLYQRDVPGAMTTPVIAKNHGGNKSLVDALSSSLSYVDVARAGSAVGIAVDDRFIGASSGRIAIKVTFLDSNTGEWSLEYVKSNGAQGIRTVTSTGTDVVRTVTFFLDDFSAPAKGKTLDFKLVSPSGNTPFMFVRVIKLAAGGGNPVPLPPQDVVVE